MPTTTKKGQTGSNNSMQACICIADAMLLTANEAAGTRLMEGLHWRRQHEQPLRLLIRGALGPWYEVNIEAVVPLKS